MSEQHYADGPSGSREEERAYWLRRADDHRRIAETADNPGSRAIHLRFEELYREHAETLSMVLSD